MHGYGKNSEDFYEKPKNLREEKKEKKEIQYCGNNVELEFPTIRQTTISSKKVDFEIEEQNINRDSAEVLPVRTDEENEVSIPDKVPEVCNSTELLENENSEIISDPSEVAEEAQTENSGCSEQQNNVVNHNENGCEEEMKIKKGENRISCAQ
jgi:hypothetical protein